MREITYRTIEMAEGKEEEGGQRGDGAARLVDAAVAWDQKCKIEQKWR